MDIAELVTLAGRAILIYLMLVGLVRLLGKRTLGMHSAFDLLVTLIVANLAGQAIFGNVAFLYALVAGGVVVGAHELMHRLRARDIRVRQYLSATPTVLVRDGTIISAALAREHLAEDEVHTMLREQGVLQIEDVQWAVLEPSGKLTVSRRASPDVQGVQEWREAA